MDWLFFPPRGVRARVCARQLLPLLLLATALAGTARAWAQGRPTYDPRAEQVVAGVVESIASQPSPFLPIGTSLTLVTSQGKLSVHLGPRRPAATGLRVGDQIAVTGAMTRFKGQQVLLARSIQRGQQVLTFRNQQGIPINPRGRNAVRASRP